MKLATRPMAVFITPSVLRWARNRAGHTRSTAASSLATDVDTIRAWESGRARPSIEQSYHLAKLYDRPLAFLYLPAPPACPPFHGFVCMMGRVCDGAHIWSTTIDGVFFWIEWSDAMADQRAPITIGMSLEDECPF